jgi:hypothetical protein
VLEGADIVMKSSEMDAFVNHWAKGVISPKAVETALGS